MGVLDTASEQRQQHLLEQLKLPTHWTAVPTDEILARLVVDKKRAGTVQRWILAERVGSGRIQSDVPAELVRRAVEIVTAR
jgi:3-dehydroquinate synthetase